MLVHIDNIIDRPTLICYYCKTIGTNQNPVFMYEWFAGINTGCLKCLTELGLSNKNIF